MAVYGFSISDGTRKVSAPTEAAASKALVICQNNGINSNAQFDTFLQGLTTVGQLRTALIMLIEGLIDVGPP
jgi:hypothetical protein